MWINLVFIYNGSSIFSYKDSLFHDDFLLVNPISFDNGYTIGAFLNGDNNFNGSIDEVLVYNRSLSQSEITSLFNNYSVTSTGMNRTGTPSTTGLVLDINFDDYSVADNSGNENHGTNTNVSFGVVENVLKTLTETTDYTIEATTGLFTIVNNDYSWAWMNVSYGYLAIIDSTGYDSMSTVRTGLASFADWIALIVITIAAGIVLSIILFNFNGGRNRI